ncbi:MAG: hypothetical protein GY875_04210 [Gammaproteobacteria bacterium]|nr:hypothetical protein [Gammaproteobacteria bacterium]
MKFSRLIGKAEKIVDSHEQGHPVKSAKLSKLQRLLGEKISRYQAKLEEMDDPKKREKLKTRLKVVNAQLKKSKKLSTR